MGNVERSRGRSSASGRRSRGADTPLRIAPTRGRRRNMRRRGSVLSSDGCGETAVDGATQPAQPTGSRRHGNEVARGAAAERLQVGVAERLRRHRSLHVVDTPGNDAVERDGKAEERVRDARVSPVEEAGSGRRGRRPERRGDRRAGSSPGSPPQRAPRTPREPRAATPRAGVARRPVGRRSPRASPRPSQAAPRAGGRAPRAQAARPHPRTGRPGRSRRAEAPRPSEPGCARAAISSRRVRPPSSISIHPRSRSTASGGGMQSGRRDPRSSVSAASWRSGEATALKNTLPISVGTRITVDQGRSCTWSNAPTARQTEPAELFPDPAVCAGAPCRVEPLGHEPSRARRASRGRSGSRQSRRPGPRCAASRRP